jgi:hypothetical protein
MNSIRSPKRVKISREFYVAGCKKLSPFSFSYAEIEKLMKKTLLTYAFIGLFFGIFGAVGVAAQNNFVWTGVWNVPSRFTSSTLTISAASGSSFRFKIEATNGANMGEISGIAKITGNRAYFDDRVANKNGSEKYGCTLTFRHKGTFIDVEMTDECFNYAGNGVFFSNKYYKGKPKMMETDLVYLEVFPDPALDNKFKALVGSDYERFLNSFHQIFPEEDLDGFDAKVFSACVRGICPFTAGIIMYDTKGNFWAAVLDDGAPEKIFANYYTNAPDWTNKLPATIDKWVTGKRDFNDGNLTVVYKNKK